MTYTMSERQNIPILAIHEMFNEVDNKAIISDLENYIENGQNYFIIDLGDLGFMNSVGLNLLLSMKNKCDGFTVVNASQQVESLLEMTRLRNIFDIKPSVEEAINAYSKI